MRHDLQLKQRKVASGKKHRPKNSLKAKDLEQQELFTDLNAYERRRYGMNILKRPQLKMETPNPHTQLKIESIIIADQKRARLRK